MSLGMLVELFTPVGLARFRVPFHARIVAPQIGALRTSTLLTN
jgi:hypothetical protein